jgi:hypothetical protein
VEKPPKFYVLIADRAWIWCPPLAIFLAEVVDNQALKLGFKV